MSEKAEIGKDIDGYSREYEKYKTFTDKHFRYDYGMFKIPVDARVVDIGCGFGDRIEILTDMGYADVAGVEIDEYMVKKAQQKGLDVRLGSLQQTGLEDASFDAVMVENVFHHISDYEQALDEMWRILRPEGTLSFIEPHFSIFRDLLDFMTFRTPIRKILKGPWALRHRVMGLEFESGMYPLWRESQTRFFNYLSSKFEITMHKKNMWFVFVTAKKKPVL